MARLFLLLLGVCTVTTPLFAQVPAPPPAAPATATATTATTATAAQPSTATSRASVLLLFVRADAADALEQSAFMKTPGWSIFKETGPLAGKGGSVLYVLFPQSSPSTSAAPSADVITAASSYLAQRGANRFELEPLIDFGAGAAPAARAGSAQAAPPAPEVSSDKIAQGEWQFSGERGLLLLFVKAGKETLFKGVLETLRSALEKSPDVRRRQQARGWTVMKVNGNGPSGTVVYLSVLDPVVHGVNYAPSSILSEALDGEALLRAYAEYSEALSSFNLVDLAQVRQ